ncbi:SDR family oxidoreductase [Streptomyces sp. NBC_01304]|uniref:SDR family oxidoreductase n=1 Tax=Streptomyces sp. NBC_01304 TaxID=2903818 RepID=UPI002E13331C|nr:NAD(P)H-binding protein [Streptomyces sp. NBC_01304]
MYLVTAATAPVGRSVAEQLAAAGHPVRALTRDPAKADLPAGVEAVAGDLVDPSTYKAALQGVDALFLLAVPGFDAKAFVAAAKEAGVRRIVFQSSAEIVERMGPEQRNEIAQFHLAVESAINASLIPRVHLRLLVRSSGALEWAFDIPGQLAKGDVVRGPYADAVEAPIAASDFAEIVVAHLVDTEFVSGTTRVGGPHNLTLREQIRLIGAALDRPLRYEELTPEQARKEISPYAPVEVLMARWQGSIGSDEPEVDLVQAIVGRPALSPEAWAAEAAARLTGRS